MKPLGMSMKPLAVVALVCVGLLISSVTAFPAVVGGSGDGVEGYTDTFTIDIKS
jgi:hypothetical protein